MALIYPPESNVVKELSRWDKKQRDGGMRPDRFEPFPAMLYQAKQRKDGIWDTSDPRNDAWTQGCQLVVKNEKEKAEAMERGWRESPGEALALHNAKETKIADATAIRHFEDARLSAPAQAEAAAADAATAEHVPEVKQKRAYRRKQQPAA